MTSDSLGAKTPEILSAEQVAWAVFLRDRRLDVFGQQQEAERTRDYLNDFTGAALYSIAPLYSEEYVSTLRAEVAETRAAFEREAIVAADFRKKNEGLRVNMFAIAEENDQLRAEVDRAREDAGLLDWLEATRRGIEAGTMDDQDGNPTRKLWMVEGAGVECIMPTVREAIERARKKLGDTPIPDEEMPDQRALSALLVREQMLEDADHRIIASGRDEF